jgi:hypothetical protein
MLPEPGKLVAGLLRGGSQLLLELGLLVLGAGTCGKNKTRAAANSKNLLRPI